MRKVRIQVTGHVQGVGFRFMTKIVADELSIFGSVKNESDGSVVIEAMGSEQNMQKFIEKVKASPAPYGRVNSFQLIENPQMVDTKKFITK